IVGNRAGVIGRFVVDDAYVYWIETYGTPAVKSIYRIRNDGTGEIKIVATHLTDPRYVAVDSENIYWSDREQIKYVSKASSCDSSCSSYAEAADAKGVYSYGSLYWIDSGIIKPLDISADAIDLFVKNGVIYYTTGSQLWSYDMTTKKTQAMAINLNNAGSITASAYDVYWVDRYGIEMINITAQSDYKVFSYVIRGEEICTDGIDNEDPDTLVDYYDVNDCCDLNILDAFGKPIYGIASPLGDGKCHTECGGDVDIECNGSSAGELDYCNNCKLIEGKNSRVCGDGVLNYQNPYNEVCESGLNKWKCPDYKCAGAKTQPRTGCASDCLSCTYGEGTYVKGSCGAECASDSDCGSDKCVDGMCDKPSPVQCTLNGECDETAERGVKFSGKVSGIVAPIIVVCKGDSKEEDCLRDRNNNYCGSHYSSCICSGWYGCDYECSDRSETYYMLVFDAFSSIPVISAWTKGDVYASSRYHYQCPELHISEIYDMRGDFDDVYKNIDDVKAMLEVLILKYSEGSAEYQQYKQCTSYADDILTAIRKFRTTIDNIRYNDIVLSTYNSIKDEKKKAQDAIYGPDSAPEAGLIDMLQKNCIV
ncbi:MAG: hypothetical protein HZB67_05885, partial [Candidatus Aenigmarchaeota archaeon]|nr:hypothetical protein [Candidatus Aenigmarchaeota archaeon]